MRILGIETSSPRGSVALVEGRQTVAVACDGRENAHGESIQPLLEQLLAGAGWGLQSVDAIAVGMGPGSFTGCRVGVAFAQGLSEGLERPLYGIGSLAAMALAAPAELGGVRCPVIDARRGELFYALYAPDGRELLRPSLATSLEGLLQRAAEQATELVFLGSACPALPDARALFRSEETDLPHARWTALAALGAQPTSVVTPCYVRHAVAVVPDLPPNPLGAAR